MLHRQGAHIASLIGLCVCTGVWVGCSEDDGVTNPPPSPGSVEVAAATTGQAIDPDGYTVSVDGGAERMIGVNGSVTVASLEPGDHQLELGGVAQNCTPAGSNPRTVTVPSGGVVETVFQVACSAGNLTVRTSTAGREPDPDGYSYLVPHIDHGIPIGVNDAVTLAQVPAQDLPVELTGLAPACAVLGANPRMISVPAAGTASTTFDVVCQTALRGQIVFWSDENADAPHADIYVMNVDGSGQIRLTNDAARDLDPAVSPDGRRLLFSSDRDDNREIYLMNANGSGLVNLSDHQWEDFNPVWSPDGTRIAFARSEPNSSRSAIHVMNADGSNPVGLTDGGDWSDTPAWSPDGTRIAFTSDRAAGDISNPFYTDVFVMNADGSDVVKLTDPEEPGQGGYAPAWSPDGKKISLTADQDIWVMNVDGSNPVNLTNGPPWPSMVSSWSRDGSRVAFSTRAYTSDWEVFVMNADGSSPVNRSARPHHSDRIGSPQAWSP